MVKIPGSFLSQVNFARYHGQTGGHYESFFVRGNHPRRPLAFWIRYTLFSPKNRPAGTPGEPLGELWAIFFNGETENGETGHNLAVRQEFPISECRFSTTSFDVQVGEARFGPGALQGAIRTEQHTIEWELAYHGQSAPLLLLPVHLYETRFPAAKSLVGLPLAVFDGCLRVDGETVEVDGWAGSQNHNWGRKHTDRYAWGQVAGFDAHPDSFLEIATAKLKVGPLWTPPITPIVLRHGGREYAFNGLAQSARARGVFDESTWRFASASPEADIAGEISAPPQAFVRLTYYNPPGGIKTCLNTKIAACRVQLRDRRTGTVESLESRCRAAFEILKDEG